MIVENEEFEKAVKESGFKDCNEFHHMVSDVDFTIPNGLKNFQAWKLQDGTKKGLMKLPTIKLPTIKLPTIEGKC